MNKSHRKSAFVCQQCGTTAQRWQGRCPSCGEWNSFVETVLSPRASATPGHDSFSSSVATPIARIDALEHQRMLVPSSSEFNRVLGGGLVPGSLVLIGGDPGVGKSTLLLQVAASLADSGSDVLYVSGEESAQQIKLRAERLGIASEHLYQLSETSLERIIAVIEELRPRMAVIDSIQTVSLEELESAAGSIGQLRECTMRLMRMAKSLNVPVFLVGHVTKDGAIAGPRALEHIVDAVLYLEGERFHVHRLLRGVKNRFGSTNEVGVFEMRGEGMVDVLNPSAAFLEERPVAAPGSAVIVTLEGTRPLLVEAQALTVATAFGLPRRIANGFDYSRLLLIVAVLSKRVGLSLANQDVYVNVVGGLKIGEPAADLGVALAIASSCRNEAMAADLAVIGEVGLSGELRRAGHMDRRLAEASRLGFQKCIIPRSPGGPKLGRPAGIATIEVSTVAEAVGAVWERR